MSPISNVSGDTGCTYLVSDLGALGRLGGLREEDECDREDQKEGDDEALNGSHDVWWCRTSIEGREGL
jgi:hypothetical protein